MPEFSIHNQCLFVATYALCLLLFAGTMSSEQTGQSSSAGMTKSERFVCTSCEQRNLPAFYLSRHACNTHIGKSKRCNGAVSKKVTIMTRPGDVIAGGSAGMGPCLPPQHQPPGIYLNYTWYILGIYHVYTWYIPA